MSPALALVAILVPVLAGWGFVRASGRWPTRPVAAVAGFAVAALLWVVPVDAAEGLRRLGGVDRVSPGVVLAGQLYLIAATAAVWPRLRRPDPPGAKGDVRRASRTERLAFVVQGVALSGLLASAVAGHPEGPELVERRLPTAVRWLQEGALTRPGPGEGPAGNVEVGLWLALATGHQRLAAAVGLPALLAGALATAAVARRLSGGVGPGLAGLVFLSVPAVALPAFRGGADLSAGSALLAALALFLGRREPPTGLRAGPWRALAVGLAGGACGVAAGVGPAWLPASAGLLAVLAAVDLAERRRRPLAVAGGVLALAAGSILGGAVGLLQSWERAETFRSAGGVVTTRRPRPASANVADLRAGPAGLGKRVASFWTGPEPGPAWVSLVPVGAAYGVAVALGRRRVGTDLGAIRGIALALLGVPAAWGAGFLPESTAVVLAAGLSCALAAPGFTRADGARPRLYGLVVLVAVGVGAVLLAFEPARGLRARLLADRWQRTADYGYPQVLDDLPPGTTVLAVRDGPPGAFALAGRSLTNRVLRAASFPRPFTREALARAGVDYVYDTYPLAVDELSAAGAWPIFAGVDESPPAGRPCLLWKTDRRD